MKAFYLLVISVLLLTSCTETSKKGSEVKNDFRVHNWGDSFERVVQREESSDYKLYDSDGVLEIEYEGIFYGVATDLENRIVARMSMFFVEGKLTGGWYYIYAKKEEFDLHTQLEKLKENFGEATKHYFLDENESDNYLWLGERTVIKVLLRDAGEFVRFEFYNYERNWYDKNMIES